MTVVAAAAAVVRREKRIVAEFRTAGATSPEYATTASALGVHQGRAFTILVSHGVLRAVDERRFYLDEPRWDAHIASRRRLALIMLGIVVAAGLGVFFWTLSRGR